RAGKPPTWLDPKLARALLIPCCHELQPVPGGGVYDEWMAAPGIPRPEARLLVQMMDSLPEGELQRRQQAAERAFLLMGITFAVYGHRDGAEKVWPFDLLPRLIAQSEWERLDRGLK